MKKEILEKKDREEGMKRKKRKKNKVLESSHVYNSCLTAHSTPNPVLCFAPFG